MALSSDLLPKRLGPEDPDKQAWWQEPAPSRRRVWILALALMAMLSAGAIAWRMDAAALVSGDVDMGSFWASGLAARQGLDPYRRYALVPPVAPGQGWTIVEGGENATFRNLNPPSLLPVLALLPAVDPVVGAKAAVLLSAGFYVGWLAWLAWRRRAPPARVLWALFFAGFWFTLVLAQIYLVFLALSLGARALRARRREILAGICIGALAALRPPLLAWPVLLLLAGHWRVALAAFAAWVALMALPLAIWGPAIYGEYAAGAGAAEALTRIISPQTISLAVLGTHLGGKWVGIATAGILLGSAALWAGRRRPDFEAVGRVAILVALLAAPVAWVNYLLIWLPFGMARERGWGWAGWAGAVLLTVPIILPMQALGGPLWLWASLGAIYVWGAALLLVGELIAGGGSRRSP